MQTVSVDAGAAVRGRWRIIGAPWRGRWIGLIGALILLSSLQGCSALRLVYNQVPDLLIWWADGYLDLNRGQSDAAKAAAHRWWAWQREAQLPELAEALAQVRRELPQPLTAERACHWADQVRAQADRAMGQAVPEAARLALSLQPAQLQHLAERQEKSNRGFKEDFIDPPPARQQADGRERWTTNLSRLWGDLNPRQEAAVAAAVRDHLPDPRQLDAARRARQQDVLATLSRLQLEGTTPAQAEAALSALQARLFNPPNPVLVASSRQQQQVQCALWAEVHRLSTPEQRQEAAGRLAGWEQDLRKLAAAR